jgi:hypothetical protein
VGLGGALCLRSDIGMFAIGLILIVRLIIVIGLIDAVIVTLFVLGIGGHLTRQ